VPGSTRDSQKDRAIYLAYRAGAVAAQSLPGPVGEAAARGIGRALSVAMPGRRRMASRHLRRASGGTLRGVALERAVNGAFESYARYWLEMFRLPYESRAAIDEHFEIDGYEHVEAALAAGRGCILALPHLGGWEHAGTWLHAVRREHILVVVEPVEPPELFDWFVEVRGAMGMEVVPTGGDAAARVVSALGENRIVCLVSDRDLSGDGVDVEFFGEHTTLPGGPALLALRAQAPLIPVVVYFRARGGHLGIVRPPLDTTRQGKLRDDVVRITQALAHEFESLIAAAPEQWHLMQPNWPSDRPSTNGNG
jgi:KDO2-lipid IV(A) lauroyltransferase